MVTPRIPDSRPHSRSLLGPCRCCRRTEALARLLGCWPNSGWLCTGTDTDPSRPKKILKKQEHVGRLTTTYHSKYYIFPCGFELIPPQGRLLMTDFSSSELLPTPERWRKTLHFFKNIWMPIVCRHMENTEVIKINVIKCKIAHTFHKTFKFTLKNIS